MPLPTTRLLRGTRANPPGLAAGDVDRRRVYSAALQQAEDLFEAAADVGPLARPLLLFYAVSQAGRAITAAWLQEGWITKVHGIGQDTAADAWKGNSVLDFRVEPRGGGLLAAVASATGGGQLTSGVELGALWSALPTDSAPEAGPWLQARRVWPTVYSDSQPLLPGNEYLGLIHIPGQDDLDAAQIEELLAHYPAAAGARPYVFQGIFVRQQSPWGFQDPQVMWPQPHDQATASLEELMAARVDRRIPEYGYHREHWLIPEVGAAGDELTPLLIWWGLLFGLSLLARYEPADWRAALDPDESRIAVGLEALLDEAMNVVPDLLVEALTRRRVLRAPRISL